MSYIFCLIFMTVGLLGECCCHSRSFSGSAEVFENGVNSDANGGSLLRDRDILCCKRGFMQSV